MTGKVSALEKAARRQSQSSDDGGRDLGFRRNPKTEAVTPSLFNTLLVFQHDEQIRNRVVFNSFAHRIERHGPLPWAREPGDWRDLDDVQLVAYIADRYHFEPKLATVSGAVLKVAHENQHHPVNEWLSSLHWDGHPRLGDLISRYFGAADVVESIEPAERFKLNVYHRIVGVRWLVGAIARVQQPGCKQDTMVVLQGPQGVRKSSALRLLASTPWFSDTRLPVGHKDFPLVTRGCWMVEHAEMDGLSRAEDTAIKADLSMQIDRFRAPYGRHVENIPRQFVYVGTTNSATFNKDATGGRRYWPVNVGQIDLDAIRRDREQLFAEALHRYRHGEIWWVDRERIAIDPGDDPAHGAIDHAVTEWELFAEQVESRRVIDAWQYPIVDYLEKNSALDELTTATILADALKIDTARWTRNDQLRVSNIMRLLGWRHAKVGSKNSRTTGWKRLDSPRELPSASEGRGANVPL